MEIEICKPTPEQAAFQALFADADKQNLAAELSECIESLTKDRLLTDYLEIIDGLKEESEEIEQILGKALGYPWYQDDPKNFPTATENDGVCVGIETAWSLANIAADKLKELENVKHLKALLFEAMDYIRAEKLLRDAWEGPNARLDREADSLIEEIKQQFTQAEMEEAEKTYRLKIR